TQSTLLLIKALRALLQSAEESKAALLAMNDRRRGEELWWQGFRGLLAEISPPVAPTYDKLDPLHRKTLYQACVVIATILEAVFSDPERFRRMEAIHRKIPQSFLVTSLYIINPAPFIAKILPMYVWKPNGVLSLCQRMASSLCGVSKTQARLDQLGSQSPGFRKELLDQVFGDAALSSSSPEAEYHRAAKDSELEVLTETELRYAQARVRMAEKMAYVEFLGQEGKSSLLDFMGVILPPLLNELAKVGSLASIVSSFFELLNRFWDTLAGYKEVPRPSQESVISALADHFERFVGSFYPCLYKAAGLSGTAKALPSLGFLFDGLARLLLTLVMVGSLMGWQSQEGAPYQYHENVEAFISTLDPDDQEAIWEHLAAISSLAKDGIDESQWPLCTAIEQKLVPFCTKEYLGMLSRFSV
ncbi:hypothetical protein HDU91_000826, partial [Kappamyces sp. JEL0680]